MTSINLIADAPMVLHVRVVTGTGGGPEKTILNSPRFLKQHGYRSLCAFLYPPDDPGIKDIARRGRLADTEIVPVPDRGPFDWRAMRRLLGLCREHHVAVWHGHDYKSNALGLLLRRFHRMKMVTTTHGWGAIVGRVPLYNRIDMAVLPYYERVVSVSRDQSELCEAAGVRRKRLTVIENGIDLERYHRAESSRPARESLNVPTGLTLIGAAGRLSPEKGFDVLINAIALLHEQGRDIGLVIAGDGPDRPRLDELIARQRQPRRFILLGHQPEMSPLYNAVDLFALSSLSEGLPNVLLEAMAMSLPVVATHVGGVPQLIDDQVNGLLIPSNDVPALAAAITRIIETPRLARELGRSARVLIESRFSFAKRMERMVEVYESLGVFGTKSDESIS